MSIKFKILSGFLILAAMLAIAGIWSIMELRSIGDSVENILDQELNNVNYTKNMKAALEREDSGILLVLLGKADEGMKIFNEADSVFIKNFGKVFEYASNDEKGILNKLSENYKLFYASAMSLNSLGNNTNHLDWYFEYPHKQFISTMELIDNYMSGTDESIFLNSKKIIEKSHRAIMPGIVVVIAAIVFSFIFHGFVNFYFIHPIIEITKRIRNFTSKRTPYDYQVESKDELNELNEAVEILCSHVIADEATR